MLIENGLGLERHTKTGRPLNKWNPDLQKPTWDLLSDRHNATVRAFEIALRVSEDYKKENKRATKKRLELIRRIVSWLVINNNKLLQVSTMVFNINYQMLKNIVDDLEKRELIDVYQGFSMASGGARPMAIKATIKLLKYID